MNKLFVFVINKIWLYYNMNDYNNNSNQSLQGVKDEMFSAQEAVGNIQNISKNIQDYSLLMRDTVRTIRESGVIPQIAEAIRVTTFAVRDTAKEINEATQELKKNGIVGDAASAVETTLKSAEESIKTVREITTDAENASPQTAKAIQNSIDIVRRETSQATEKMMNGVKNKVGVA